MKLKILIALAASLLSSVAVAGTWTNGNLQVKHIIWTPHVKGAYVDVSLFHDPQNCGGTERLYAIDTSLTEAEINQILSIMLSAKSQKLPIHFWVDGCVGTRPKVKGIQLNPL